MGAPHGTPASLRIVTDAKKPRSRKTNRIYLNMDKTIEENEIENGLRKALRWPEDFDTLATDMDSRGSMERAVAYVMEQLRRVQQETREADTAIVEKILNVWDDVDIKRRRSLVAYLRSTHPATGGAAEKP
jgi:polyhydroxyalkanoate synthesis regulator phasin